MCRTYTWSNCSYTSRQTLLRRSGLNKRCLDRGFGDRCRKVCRDYLLHRSVQFYIRKFSRIQSYQNGTCAVTEERQKVFTSKYWRIFSVGKLKIQSGSEKSGLIPVTENWYGQKLHASLQ